MDKALTQIATLDIKLKDTCSRVRPELLLTNKYDCNYCYIPDFHRYYFVEDAEQTREKLWRYKCKSDGLSSFKQAIRSNRAIILKTADENYNDKLFDDGFVETTLRVDRHNEIINFPNQNNFHINDGSVTDLQMPIMLLTSGPGGGYI